MTSCGVGGAADAEDHADAAAACGVADFPRSTSRSGFQPSTSDVPQRPASPAVNVADPGASLNSAFPRAVGR